MDFASIRKEMLDIATSEMTKNRKYKKLLKDTLSEGLFTLDDGDGNSICYDRDQVVEDTCFNEEDLSDTEKARIVSNLGEDPQTISLYFAYEFDKGHMKRDKPKKFIPTWDSAFDDCDYDSWEARVCDRLGNLVYGYPYAWVDSDSDFGYQAFILYVSQAPRDEVFDTEDEDVEEGEIEEVDEQGDSSNLVS